MNSTLPFLLAFQFGILLYVWRLTKVRVGLSRAESVGFLGLLAVYVIWTGTSIGLSLQGHYANWAMKYGGGLWIPFLPVMIVLTLFLAVKPIRTTVLKMFDSVPLHWIVAFQGLRVLAIGGIIKGIRGEFPLYYAMWIGVPDFLFGVASLVGGWLIYKNRMGQTAAVILNLIGMSIIVPAGILLIPMGLPGSWQFFHSQPSILSILEFPMVLAPTGSVPIFIMLNMLIVARLTFGSTFMISRKDDDRKIYS